MKHLVIFLLIIAPSTLAQSVIYGSDDEFPRILDLNWLNNNFLNKQRKRVDALTRSEFGIRIKNHVDNENTLENIRIIQRVINENKIDQEDKVTLQALGVVLGDVYVANVKELHWKVFEDDLGKSHAVCVEDTKHCIFPITMLSRRVEVGVTPDVQRVYDKGYSLISDYLTKLPFSN